MIKLKRHYSNSKIKDDSNDKKLNNSTTICLLTSPF